MVNNLALRPYAGLEISWVVGRLLVWGRQNWLVSLHWGKQLQHTAASGQLRSLGGFEYFGVPESVPPSVLG